MRTPVVLRVLAGLLWLSNASWKVPPNFGRSQAGCRGLCGFVNAGVEHGPPGWSWFLERLVAPNLGVFGYGVMAVELVLAAALLSGTFVRPAALLGAAQSAAIGLSVANAPGEWYWSYFLMVGLHLAIFELAPAGGPVRRRPLAIGLLGYGVVMAIANAKNDVLASSFTRRWVLFGGPTDFPGDFGRNVFAGSVGLGVVFLLAGLAVLVVATGAQARVRVLGLLCMAGALVLTVGYTDSGNLLGAKTSAAAVLLAAALALIAGATSRSSA